MKINAMKKEETELADERRRLLLQKWLHIRDSKRLADEAISPMNKFPLMNGRYQLLNLLGKGGFSEVYEAFDTFAYRFVACKVHSMNQAWPEIRRKNYTKHACREYNIHKELVHPKVVRLFDVIEIDDNSFVTVLELCTGGDLDSHLKQHGALGEKESRAIMAQIFSGLAYLHTRERPIIHYDQLLFHFRKNKQWKRTESLSVESFFEFK